MLNIERMFVQKMSERTEKRIKDLLERTMRSEKENDMQRV